MGTAGWSFYLFQGGILGDQYTTILYQDNPRQDNFCHGEAG
ncbi:MULTISPECIES: hypothetical protein [Rhodopirellula]|uniref:Uncharacterized protein n=1 Tax=Rhodopirellula europaea 6C TaxID=1263867 RepID=M2B2H3_9BACT|nr:hypothetical protein [Rhodopirellula europaea]EMB16404.1 hypothetical protein RE6C_02769 [Rhodopirellula europaea 6C]